MTKPLVTIVSPTLAGNALLRTDVFRRLLADAFDLQIVTVGPPPDRIFEPLADVPEYQRAHRIKGTTILALRSIASELDRAIRGDAVVCIKPLMHSYGVTLLACRRTPRPVLLDIDDWEIGFLSNSPYWEMRSWRHRWLTALDSPLHTRLLDGFIYKAKTVTVSNSFLQGLYGGHWIPHARDNEIWVPQPVAPGLPPRVMFAGSPRGHKGLRTLLLAWELLKHPTAILELAVPDPRDSILAELRATSRLRVQISGPHPFTEMPGLVASASIVVVPQDNAPGALGQLPMKLIDAMAAGRAIVATDVCDASRWLSDGAGVIVSPGSPTDLAAAIDRLLASPHEAEEVGRRARQRFLALASERALRPKAVALVTAALEGRAVPCAPAFTDDTY
jgi:glycosyltransferase involved in cell wall biosynthesis